MSKTLELRLLGRLEIQQGGMPLNTMQADKTMALLSYLAVTGRSHTRSALAGLLWGGLPEARARGNLSKALSTLRQVDGDHLTITRQMVSFNQDSHVWLDVTAFEAKVTDHSPLCLQEAVGLYQGDFLDGFSVRHAPEFEAWVLVQQARLKGVALQALHTLAAHYAEQGEPGRIKAIDYTNQLLRLEPWREEAHRQMMRLLAWTGQRGAALAQYETCRQVLAQELGVEPGLETIALHDQIRIGDDEVADRSPPAMVSRAHDLVDLPRDDLLEMPDSGLFFGRELELAQLRTWIVDEGCRLAVILGVGGMGKTSLAARFVASLRESAGILNHPNRPFAKIMWRSLLNAPPLTTILRQSILFLSDQQLFDIPTGLDEQLRLLIKLLQQQRCLLVLDNAESIMQVGQGAGTYRAGYEGYGQLIKRVARSDHQSCLLLTSRESPQELARLVRDTPLVRSQPLRGLPKEVARQVLAQHGLSSAGTHTATLIQRYSGHPLALKLVAETIDDLYFGDVEAFLKQDTLIFADIHDVLDQHFARLSPLEQEIMTWLVIEREPVSVQALGEDLLGPVTQREYLETLRSLQGRSLLEKYEAGVGLQNVITEYTTDRFIDQVCQELGQDVLDTFNRHALIKAQAKDYVRESQERLILQPISETLLERFGRAGLEQRLNAYLDRLRSDLPKGYAGGNILNFLLHIKSDISHFDFSGIAVWQAYLQGKTLPDVDFRGANLEGAVFTDTFGVVGSVAFSPDGQFLAVGTGEGQIQIWRTVDWQPVQTMQSSLHFTGSLCFSPDGRILVAKGLDHTVCLWDVASSQSLQILQGHTDAVFSFCFSPDGQVLASGSDDQTIRLWDLSDVGSSGNYQTLQVLQGHSSWIDALCFSPDGQTLASGSGDGTIRLWKVADVGSSGNYQTLQILRGHTNLVNSVCFSPDGQTLASGSEDGMIRLWKVADVGSSGSHQNFRILQGHTGAVTSVCFSPDGQTLASGSGDQTVRLWDVVSGQIRQTIVGHTNAVISVCFSPDGQTLASGGNDQTVRLWDLASGQTLQVIEGHASRIYSICFSPDGWTLASGGTDRIVRLWDVINGHVLQTLQGHSGWVNSVCFSPDGQTLASGGWGTTLRLWDVTSGQGFQTAQADTESFSSICFSPDGQTLASGMSRPDQIVRLWDIAKGQIRQTLEGHTSRINSVCFSPDGQILATGSKDQTIRLWHVASGQTIQILQGHTDEVHSACFSPNGRTLASGSTDQTVRLWDVVTGQLLQTLQEHTDEIKSVCFSPDGRTLVSGGADRTLRLWEVTGNNSRLLQTLEGHTSWINSVCFSPDGRTLASGGADDTIKFWAVKTGDCLSTLRPDRPYERMNITGVTGITEAQKATLKALGAVDLG